MNDTLKRLVQAFESMTEAYRMMAERLTHQLDQLQEAHGGLKAYSQRLEANSNQLASTNRDLVRLVADLEVRIGEIQAQNALLQDKDQLKTDFLATVAHEIRTPLTAIKGSLSLLLHDPGGFRDETRLEFLVLAHQNVERLLRLINNYFSLARIETGQLVLDRQPVELGSFIRTAIARVQGMAQERGIQVVHHGPAGPVKVLADLDMLESVLVNLLDNAIKFSPERGVIQVNIEEAPQEVTVRVADRGAGIPPGDLPRVFERFYRVAAPGVRVTGSGLGLHICKAILEEHGGRIWVESQVGQGSTFSFTLSREGNR
jgi:signal transduction histidine kinase